MTFAEIPYWMTAPEAEVTRALYQGLRRYCAAEGAQDSCILALRLEEIAHLYAVAKRVSCPLDDTAEDGLPKRLTPTEAESIGKAWERLRKATADLLPFLPTKQAGPESLADAMAPLVAEAEKALAEMDSLDAEEAEWAELNTTCCGTVV